MQKTLCIIINVGLKIKLSKTIKKKPTSRYTYSMHKNRLKKHQIIEQ